MPAITVSELGDADRAWACDVVRERWNATLLVSRGRVHHAEALDGLVATLDGERAGLATLDLDGDACEIVTLDALVFRMGIGKTLLEHAAAWARERGCRRLWLVTTNDNEPAQRFYERCGLALVTVHNGSVDEARKLKPEMAEYGVGGVRITDELEYELRLPRHGAR